MGAIGSLIIHSLFLLLSSYIHIGQAQREEERLIEVSLVNIPAPPIVLKEKPIQIKIKGPIVPHTRNEAPSLRGKPKRVASEELSSKKEKEGGRPFQFIKPKLDLANTYGEIRTSTKTEEGVGEDMGKGVGTGEEKGEEKDWGGPWTLEITGEVARRAIIYQEGFRIPEWLERKGISLEGRFKFWVTSDGSVDRVLIEHSFGYGELDTLAINSILRWRFCPLKSGTYEEWGIARIKIKLK